MDTKSEIPQRSELRHTFDVMKVSQTGLFILAILYTLYFIKPVLLPIILALLLALILTPLQKFLRRVTRLPAPVAALLVIAVFFTGLSAGIYYLSQPATAYTQLLKEELVQNRLKSVFSPFTKIQKEIENVANKVESISEDTKSAVKGEEEIPENENKLTKNGSDVEVSVRTANDDLKVAKVDDNVSVKSESLPVQVEIRKNSVDVLYNYMQEVVLYFFLTMALVFFFLAFGNRMIRKVSEFESAKTLVEDVASDVSRYLFTITVINLALGVVTTISMFLLGMPNPLLWGTMAALLNFIPYIGAIGGTAIVFIVAAITFHTPASIAAVPVTYYLLTFIEGNFITPAIIGGRFTINPIIVFLWVVAWGALWGVPGMLIGLPLLMVFRIMLTRVPALAHLEKVIST